MWYEIILSVFLEHKLVILHSKSFINASLILVMKAAQTAAILVLSLIFLILVFLSPQAMAMDPNLSSSRCGRGYPHPFVGTSSHWPFVDPNNPFRQVEGTVLWSKVTHTDNPLDHKTHDWNFLVKPDP
jgi:hypothetical protein